MAHDTQHRKANRESDSHRRYSNSSMSRRQAAHQRKRMSRSDPTVLHIDPFIDHPNPLDCHPCYHNEIKRANSCQDLKSKRHFSLPVQLFSYEDALELGLVHRNSNPLEEVMRTSIRNSISSAVTSAARVGSVATVSPMPIKMMRASSHAYRVKKSSSTGNLLFRSTVDTVVRPLFSLVKAHSTIGLDVDLNDYPKHERHRKRGEDGVLHPSTPNKGNPRTNTRIFDSEAPSGKIPSCSGLPGGWAEEHDRFVAYLATHGPLNEDGHKEKWAAEFHTTLEIASLIRERFEKFSIYKIPEWAIEKRLDILELLDNDYFNQDYGCYKFFEWGHNI